jgi:hypothetical protein
MCSDRTAADAVTTTASTALELDDIQFGMLHQRPASYVGTYLLLRIDNREAGRKLVRRLLPVIESARSPSDPDQNAWVSVAFTYQGLKALGVPEDSLDSFAPEFRQGMAARAAELGDVGLSDPENWEQPLGSPEVHVALSVLSPDAARLESLVERARRAHEELAGVEVIWRQDCYQLPTGRTSFGFKDGIGQPAVEGSGIAGSNPGERPIKAGEFILGYPDETGSAGRKVSASNARDDDHGFCTPHSARMNVLGVLITPAGGCADWPLKRPVTVSEFRSVHWAPDTSRWASKRRPLRLPGCQSQVAGAGSVHPRRGDARPSWSIDTAERADHKRAGSARPTSTSGRRGSRCGFTVAHGATSIGRQEP